MKNKHNKAIIHLIPLLLVGVLILIGGYFFVSQDSQTPIIIQSSPTPEVIVEGGMNDWDTYKNTQWGIQFDYPSFVILGRDKPACRSYGAQPATETNEWGCTLDIFHSGYESNKFKYFLHLTSTFNQKSVNPLSTLTWKEAERVTVENTLFNGLAAKKRVAYKDEKGGEIYDITYGISTSPYQSLFIRVFPDNTSLSVKEITSILDTLIVEKNVVKPKELY